MFSRNELEAMRQTQEAHMMDTCVIYRVTTKTKDKRGMYQKTLDEGTESICGLQMDPVALNNGESYRTAEIDAVLRLPHGVIVKPEDEIEITKRFDEEITSQRYEVDRYVNEGPSGGRAYLKVKAII